MDTQYTQAQMDARDLQIGRLFVALNDALAQNKQLADLCRSQGADKARLEGTLKERDEKIAELRELVASLADDDEQDDDLTPCSAEHGHCCLDCRDGRDCGCPDHRVD